MPKYLDQSWKFKTSTSNHFWNFKILKTNHTLNRLLWWKCKKIAYAKSSPKCCHFLGLLQHFKINEHPKVSQLGEKLPKWVTLNVDICGTSVSSQQTFQVSSVLEASVRHSPPLSSNQPRPPFEGLHLHDVTGGAHPDILLHLFTGRHTWCPML